MENKSLAEVEAAIQILTNGQYETIADYKQFISRLNVLFAEGMLYRLKALSLIPDEEELTMMSSLKFMADAVNNL